MPIRIAIVEDDIRVRDFLTTLFEGSNGFQCVGTHASAEEALCRIFEGEPDVVLMDILLPSMSGIDCARLLKAQDPNLLVVMFTGYDEDELLFGALGAGADGYLMKYTQPAELLQSIADVVHGGAPMSKSIARRVLQFFHANPGADAMVNRLSRREREILQFHEEGYLLKEIAERLGISFETVHSHIQHIKAKTRIQAGTRRSPDGAP